MRTAMSGSVKVQINAPAERVWGLLSHLERMGEWSPECYRVKWQDGAASPAVPGARFRGWNRYGWMRWSMTCRVNTAVPGKELSYSTVVRQKEVVTWTYRIEPSGSGVELGESFEVRWLPFSARVAEDFLMRDRDRRREQAMQATLERIKQIAESEEA